LNFIRRDDKDLLEDLVDSQVFSLADFARMKTPETGYLMEALLSNRTEVNEGEWIYWLARKHGCIRLACVRTDREWVEEQNFTSELVREMRDASVFPVSKSDDGWLVGVGRHFDKAHWAARLRGEITPVAVTLAELHKLQTCFAYVQ